MTKHQSVTALPRSPEDDRRNRMIKYSVTMGIRIVCVVLCLFVRGWWLAVVAAGAVFLPYIAVVLANVTWAVPSKVVRPGTIVPLEQTKQERTDPRTGWDNQHGSQQASGGDK
jgi:hypothetical protein